MTQQHSDLRNILSMNAIPGVSLEKDLWFEELQQRALEIIHDATETSDKNSTLAPARGLSERKYAEPLQRFHLSKENNEHVKALKKNPRHWSHRLKLVQNVLEQTPPLAIARECLMQSSVIAVTGCLHPEVLTAIIRSYQLYLKRLRQELVMYSRENNDSGTVIQNRMEVVDNLWSLAEKLSDVPRSHEGLYISDLRVSRESAQKVRAWMADAQTPVLKNHKAMLPVIFRALDVFRLIPMLHQFSIDIIRQLKQTWPDSLLPYISHGRIHMTMVHVLSLQHTQRSKQLQSRMDKEFRACISAYGQAKKMAGTYDLNQGVRLLLREYATVALQAWHLKHRLGIPRGVVGNLLVVAQKDMERLQSTEYRDLELKAKLQAALIDL
ncbi:MAG: hypothetical protein HQM12_14145 [SAR324 cluster bacterium]|nr:hypothetical protein [SAR324 cluster bacterium]